MGENRHLGGKVKIILREEKVILANWGVSGEESLYPQVDREEDIGLDPPEQIRLNRWWILTVETQECHLDKKPEPIFEENEYRVQIDADQACAPLTVGVRKPGERFQPLGMEGTMKISDFMVNEKIPVSAREKWPLVRSGGQVVWVPGYRIAHSVRLTADTQRVYSLSLDRRGDQG